jgi:gliding motility-associated-like protein
VTDVCENDPSLITYTGNASANAIFTWDFAGGNIVSGSGSGPYSVSWNTSGNYSVSLTVTEPTCSSVVSMPVTVNPIPVASITTLPPLCEGQTGTVSFNGSAGAGATYTWNTGNAVVISGGGSGPFDLQWNSSGSDQISVTVTDNNCVATADLSVQINPIPTADFTIDNAACINQPVQFTYTGSAGSGANYGWDFQNGNVLNGNGQGPYSVSWNAAGTYPVSLTVSENGCTSPPFNLPAIITDIPFANAGTDQTACSGETLQIGNTAVPGETYAWLPSTGLSNPAASNPTLNLINTGNSISQNAYVLQVTNSGGCSNTDTIEINTIPEPVVNFVTPAPQCIEGNNFQLTGNSNVSGLNFLWTMTPQANILTSNQQIVSLEYSSTGTFPVILQGDLNGCQAAPVTQFITVNEMPEPDFIPMVFEGCEPLIVPFTNLSPGNTNSYEWNFYDGNGDTIQDPVHVFNHAGVYSVTLSAVNIHGCTKDTTLKDVITVYPTPAGRFFPNPPVVNILTPVVQFQNSTVNGNAYVWDFGDSSFSYLENPEHSYSATGEYLIRLIAISDQGCIDTVYGKISVEDNFSFYVPNSFTPNDDGVNDFFKGYGVTFKDYTLSVYNRWGELIYRTENYNMPWDGRLNSGVVQNDVYVYRIVVTDNHDNVHTYVGNVSVIK